MSKRNFIIVAAIGILLAASFVHAVENKPQPTADKSQPDTLQQQKPSGLKSVITTSPSTENSPDTLQANKISQPADITNKRALIEQRRKNLERLRLKYAASRRQQAQPDTQAAASSAAPTQPTVPPPTVASTSATTQQSAVTNFAATSNDSLPKIDDSVSVDKQPEAISSPPPEYPEVARRLHRVGQVIVRFLISKQGDVLQTHVERATPTGQGFEEKATAAVKNWKFKPAMKNGQPVAYWVTQPVRFTLR